MSQVSPSKLLRATLLVAVSAVVAGAPLGCAADGSTPSPDVAEPDNTAEPDALEPDGTPDAPAPGTPTPDAPAPDAPTPDAPAPDAPTPDAPTPDAPAPDAPTPDAPAPDAEPGNEPDPPPGCTYPAGEQGFNAGQVIPPYQWANAFKADGSSDILRLEDAACDSIEWSPFDTLVFIAIPAW